MDRAGAVEEKAVVALAEPQEEAGDDEEDGERGREQRVELLAGVEAPLRRPTPAEPPAVVGVERLDLAPVGSEPAAVAEHQNEHDRRGPDERGAEMEVLDEVPARDRLGQDG